MPWRSWINAEVYDRFVRERPIYGWLNRRLVELASIRGARRIHDLGCGTGATTVACLREMDARAEIVGTDASEEMIRVARANVLDPRARFEVLAAADTGRLEGPFDRVVCNAAFWQFPAAAPVFRALASHTETGARIVLNVPAERVVGERAPVHPFQVALLQRVESEMGHMLEDEPVTVDPSLLAAQAERYGFVLRGQERCVYEGRQGELMELMSIPAMIEPLTPGFSDEAREAVLEAARSVSDPEQPVLVPWMVFLLERRSD